MALQVEFYGMARQRAGVAATTLPWPPEGLSLGLAISELERQFPRLAESCFDGGRLQKGYVANISGRRFVSDPQTPLCDDEVLLIMSSEAGG